MGLWVGAFLLLARPRTAAPPPSMGGVLALLLAPLALVAIAIWLVVAKGRRVKQAAHAAFVPLGLTPASWGILGWQATGLHSHRGVRVMVSAGQRYAPSSLVIEITCRPTCDVSIAPRMGTTGSWLRAKIAGELEVPVVVSPHVSVHSTQPAKAHEVVNRAAHAVAQLLAGGHRQARYVYLRPGVAKLHAIGDAWQNLTAGSLRADLDALAALASAAES